MGLGIRSGGIRPSFGGGGLLRRAGGGGRLFGRGNTCNNNRSFLRNNNNNNNGCNNRVTPPPPVNNNATVAPPVNNNRATVTPPVNNNATVAPPVNNTTTVAPPNGNAGPHNHVNLPDGLLTATPDGNQINAWRQTTAGNCSSVACIKAATEMYGKDRVFDRIEQTGDGNFNVTLQDGRQVSLTGQELRQATEASRFIELGQGRDIDFANFAYATMAKNKMGLNGYGRYDQALRSLNDGENPWDAARWLGIPKDRLISLNAGDRINHDGFVAWNSAHAVMVDRQGGDNGQNRLLYDSFGTERPYNDNGGGGVSYRRGRWGRTYAVQNGGGNAYPDAYGFRPLPAPPGPAPVNNNNGGVAPAPAPVNNNNGGVAPAPAPVNTTPPPAVDVPRTYSHREYQQALEAAAQLGLPLVIKGGASWCGPCQSMARNTFPDARVQEQLRNAIFVDVEADRHGDTQAQAATAQRLLQQLGVNSYPTTMVATVMNRDGNLAAMVNDSRGGNLNADTLAKWLAATLPEARAIMQQRGFGQ